MCPTLSLSLSLSLSTVEGVLTSVYLRSRTLVIESRDCISSPQNYRIIVANGTTTLVNLPLNPTGEYDLGDLVSSPGTVITVQLVDTRYNTTIDKRNYTIMYPTPTVSPNTEPGLLQFHFVMYE